MEVPPIEEQIRDVLSKLAFADDADAAPLAEELRRLLRQHDGFVRQMASKIAHQLKEDQPSARAA